MNIKKILNFILNQLGFVVLVIVGILFYRDTIELNFYTVIFIAVLLAVIFLISQWTWRSLQRDKLNK